MDPQETAPGTSAPIGPGGGAQPAGDDFSRLAGEVGNQFGAGTAPRGQGKRGPDKKPRKRRDAPLAGDGTDAAPVCEQTSSGDAPPDSPPRFALPPDLLADIGREAAEALDQYRVGRVTKAAIECGIPEPAAKPVIESVAMGPKRKDLVAKLTPFAVQEWGADSLTSPTAALLALVAISELTAIRAIQAFRSEAAAKKAAEQPAPTANAA